MTLLLAGIAVLALVEVVVNVVLRPQVGPPALLATFEPHLLAIGAVCGALALLLTINERTPQASRIRVIAIAVIVVALVRVGGEWWSPGDNRVSGASPTGTRLTVTTWNLEVDSKDPEDVIEGILSLRLPRRPQVVALQELTPDVGAAIDASEAIDERFPYRILRPREGVLGMGLLSSIPLLEGDSGLYPMFVSAGILMPDGSRLDLVNAHPLPPTIASLAGIPVGLDTRQRDIDLAYLRDALDRTGDPERVLLVGDLNATPFEHGFGVVAEGLLDVHAEVASGTGFTWRPAFLEALDLGLLRIDHVLAGAALRPIAVTEECSLPGDHCRVTAVVDVPDAD